MCVRELYGESFIPLWFFALNCIEWEREKSTNSFEAIRIYCEAILEMYKK